MDGVGNTHGGVLVLGATNVPWELDPGNISKINNYFSLSLLISLYLCLISYEKTFRKESIYCVTRIIS